MPTLEAIIEKTRNIKSAINEVRKIKSAVDEEINKEINREPVYCLAYTFTKPFVRGGTIGVIIGGVGGYFTGDTLAGMMAGGTFGYVVDILATFGTYVKRERDYQRNYLND